MATSRKLARDVAKLTFTHPVSVVYHPLEYARSTHEHYLRLYGNGSRRILLLGMNPGPWGMAQTGVPFGEVRSARDWLGIEGPIGRPAIEHPKRPVLGFACPRSEVSGARLWGWARDTFGTPRRFFEKFFVANYCPLAFLDDGGRNLTPDKLPAPERAALEDVCDRALRALVKVLSPSHVIGVGAFAEKRAAAALDGDSVMIGKILHPSPASPAANRDWARTAAKQFSAMGIALTNG